MDGADDGLSAYDFELPDGAIALRPAVPRDAARMLVSRPDGLVDAAVRDLPQHLLPGDILVVNDSKVVPARLVGLRRRADAVAAVELTLLAEDTPRTWRAFGKPAKRLAAGDQVEFSDVVGTVLSRDGPTVRVAFTTDPLAAGTIPLPPYIAALRASDGRDAADYQTVFAEPPGSVAAPTAGLHFTPDLIEALAARGIGFARVTLHVGAGTFLPIKADRFDGHEMHAERGIVSADAVAAIEAARAAGGRVVAVGTTATRLLESAAAGGPLVPFDGDTRLFIRPGHRFRAVDALMTNFHLPRSTLIVLVAAFVGQTRMRALYDHALDAGYRFYSYGDASLLFPRGDP